MTKISHRTIQEQDLELNASSCSLGRQRTVGSSFAPGGQGTEMKECSRCHVVKGLEGFSRRKDSADGLRAECKSCRKAQAAQWYVNNREKILEQTTRWKKSNPEKLCEYTARWRSANAEKVCDIKRRWYAANAGKIREKQARFYVKNIEKLRERRALYVANNIEKCREGYARWGAANPEKVARKDILRRTRLQQARVPWANQEAIAEIYRLRDQLTKETGTPHHVDHIVPLRSKLVCGLHVHNNLQVVPAVENLRKGNRFIRG